MNFPPIRALECTYNGVMQVYSFIWGPKNYDRKDAYNWDEIEICSKLGSLIWPKKFWVSYHLLNVSMKSKSSKGPSINDVSSKGERGVPPSKPIYYLSLSNNLSRQGREGGHRFRKMGRRRLWMAPKQKFFSFKVKVTILTFFII